MGNSQHSVDRQLATPVKFLKGCGPDRAELFHKLELRTAVDVLFFFPRDYQDLTDVRDIGQLEDGALVTVHGVVEEVEHRNSSSGGTVTGVLIRQGQQHLRALWFNQAFIREKFRSGQTVLVSGQVKLRGLVWQMTHPRVQWPEDEPDAHGRLLPVYPLVEGLKQSNVRRVVEAALSQCVELLEEVFPEEYLTKHNLMPLEQALPQIHFPSDAESLNLARRRFIYQELFVLQLALATKRQSQQAQAAPSLPATPKIDERIRRLLPFKPTGGQEQAIADIAADMARQRPMNRLLQGDVGSGKTVVAVYAMLLAVAHHHQAALMAPTEILAHQHVQTLSKMLSHSQVRMAELVGGRSARQRRETLEQLAEGNLDLVIGTHALASDDVRFPRLGLVVIDEQHKFGVRQRAMLRHAGLQPHYLVMTATPIPRTVTMTQYGDLDISTLRDSPPGRQPVNTYLAGEEQRQQWWEFFRKKLREGRQGYVITPRVEESDEVASAEERFEALSNGELEAFRLGLVHGRLKSAEKDEQMAAFSRGELQVLICTTAVEVGVDVPNATLMTIEGGEKFGLAQLHQLRGRVSRGTHPGFCTVFADPKTDEAQQRLSSLVDSSDGFHLAELDFQMRGPGDLLGTRQHGLPPLRIADLQRDSQILAEAREDAVQMIRSDPNLEQPQHAGLRNQMLRRYGEVLDLGVVG